MVGPAVNLRTAQTKLEALKALIDGRLSEPRALYFDPPGTLDLFTRYATILSFLRETYPDLFDDVNVRPMPEPSETSDHEGRGYIERRHLGLLQEDVQYCLALIPAIDPALDLARAEPVPRPASGKTPSIFLSYSSKDQFFVRKLAERLEAHGIRVWLDEAELKIGDSLTDIIGRAIQETDYFGIVLSGNSIQSRWVQKELAEAMAKELSSPDVVVLPLLLESVAVPPFLSDKVYADFSTPEKFEETFQALLTALGGSSEEVEAEDESGMEAPAIDRMEATQAVSGDHGIDQTPSEERMTRFEDIRIVGLDTNRSHNPDPMRKLYYMYLRLSDPPPEEWQRAFDAERSFPRHTMWRKAWIEGEYLVIHCVPDELERYHQNDLVQDVAAANTKYRSYLLEQAEIERKARDTESTDRAELEALSARLDFDPEE